MHRRLSTIVSSSKALATSDDDSVTTAVPEEPLAPLTLKVKRLDHYYSRWSRNWKYKNTSTNAFIDDLPFLKSESDSRDNWKDCSFVIVREVKQTPSKDRRIEIKFVIKSPYLRQACKDVIQRWPGVSWNATTLNLDPNILLTWLPGFEDHKAKYVAKKPKSQADHNIISTLDGFISTLRKDYALSLAAIDQLVSHGEISFEYLFAILVPRTYFVSKCSLTGLPRVFKLVHAVQTTIGVKSMFSLALEFVDVIDDALTPNSLDVARVHTNVLIPYFKGTVKITDLAAYPLKYAPNEQEIRKSVIKRGEKWKDIITQMPLHRQYSGVTAFRNPSHSRISQELVKGRIMIDRVMFKRFNPDYSFNKPAQDLELSGHNAQSSEDDLGDPYNQMRMNQTNNNGHQVPPGVLNTNDIMVDTRQQDSLLQGLELTADDLLLTPTTVYGFSFNDKKWREFSVDLIQPVQWNDQAFANLVLSDGRKDLLKCLVESHNAGNQFDDFIRGKGKGLVVNLFGPPGVGKTFSAEATSEHVKKPLYIVGAGDLGTGADKMEVNLDQIFTLATAWKAIVLIDEADVFMEQRSLTDLERNAMVATFLRHLEYYQGQLFLTTNRIQAFDDAFLSRIHVALHFTKLSEESRTQIWSSFIANVDGDVAVSSEELAKLAKYDVNGRQIKNAVRTAHSLAVGNKEILGFNHFKATIEMMEEFEKEFAAVTGR